MYLNTNTNHTYI